jgi:transcriptional regulator with XRE-family HTH domain
MSYEIMRDRLSAREGVNAGYEQERNLIRLGSLFRRARIAANLGHEEVAMRAGVERSEIRRLEMGSGEKGSAFDTLVKIARALDMQLVVELVPSRASASAAEGSLRAVF